jgi:Spy/CpxP family protein refolding chaperone
MVFGKLAMLREELDLSEGQITQLTDIAQQAREQNAPYREQMKGGLHEAAKVLLADPSATAQAQAILDQQFAAEKEMKKNVLLSVSKALNVLTPEQRAKLQEHLAKRAARF